MRMDVTRANKQTTFRGCRPQAAAGVAATIREWRTLVVMTIHNSD
jgi:hypothetical protein